MRRIFRKKTTIAGIAFLLIGMALALLSASYEPGPTAAGSPHQVHLAFGFHVNLYHSFRQDSNDENGFGQDIRIIRHIIRTLDHYNRQGIPVKGVWDFDNLFSLEEILPTHAPDIIADIKRRVHQNGDEVILMSYNNGLASAMTNAELTAAMSRAITNPNGSGIADIFGKIPRIVRPQEMMTTPGNFRVYNELGIDHVALYYSATPFDAFRMFVRELSPAEAYNPLLYRNRQTGEKTTIIPSYHIGDLVEHVNLKHWVKKLNRMQKEGTINRDMLLFINFDADAEFWYGGDLPWYLDWLPYAGGLSQLVEMVADLDFVSFSTLGEYIAGHPPVGTVQFSQDTADGSFHGYHSWSEKAYTADLWTPIVENRRIANLSERLAELPGKSALPDDLNNLIADGFEIRLRALSTTHFGLATPFLSPQREKVVNELARALTRNTRQIEKRFNGEVLRYLENSSPPAGMMGLGKPINRFLVIDPVGNQGLRQRTITLARRVSHPERLTVSDHCGQSVPVIPYELRSETGPPKTALKFPKTLNDGVYFIYLRPSAPDRPRDIGGSVLASRYLLKNETMAVYFNDTGSIEEVRVDGVRVLGSGSLMPFLRYNGEKITPGQLKVTVLADDNRDGATVRLRGAWRGPAGVTRRHGWIDYRYRVVPGAPYLYIEGVLQYPETDRQDLTSQDKPLLSRRIDRSWQAAGPIELRFAPQASLRQPVTVQKRNFLGYETSYALDYFQHDHRNLTLDSVNNHVTAEYVSVFAGGWGMAMAMDTRVRASFAFCPLRIKHHPDHHALSVSANPFGTYDGKQFYPPTRGNRLGYETTLLTGPQFHSTGPTFNGHRSRFAIMVAFFKNAQIPEEVKADLIGYARPAAVLTTNNLTGIDSIALDRNMTADRPETANRYQTMTDHRKKTDLGHFPTGLKAKIIWSNLTAWLAGAFG